MDTLVASLIAAVSVATALALLWHRRRQRRFLLQRLRQLETQGLQQANAYQEARLLLDSILRGAPGLFVITDGRRTVRHVSPQAAHLFDTTEQGAVGRSLIVVARDHQLNELVGQCLERQEAQYATLEYGGSRRVFQVRVLPTRNHRGGVNGTVVTMQDVTELRRLERVRQEFVANISHELRTPLASIKAMVETLQGGAMSDPSAAQDFLRRIGVEVDHLAQLVSELSLLSNIESGLTPLERRPVSIQELVRGAVERLTPQANRGQVQVTEDIPPTLPLVLADPSRMEQVMMNLLHNAIKFTPPGGSITVDAEPRDGQVQVRVRDTGVGISQDDLPRVFERFYKVDKARTGEGTGLGLSLVKHVVLSHGGQVWAESEEGRGSTFFFTLPLGTTEDAAPESPHHVP